MKGAIFTEGNGRLYVTTEREEGDDKVDIVIKNYEGEYTHTKYLPNTGHEVTIDLTPYCKAYMNGTIQFLLEESDPSPVDSLSAGLGVTAKLAGITYPARFSGYPQQYGILTKLPYLQVSEARNGSVDPLYLGVYGDDDMAPFIDTDTVSIELLRTPNMQFCTIPGDAKSLHLNDKNGIYDDHNFINPRMSVRTVPRGMNTRRLVWRNELGGIDSWSFEFLRESTFSTTSDVFYSTLNGYTRTNRQYERLNIIETREVDDRVANALAYITASPEVYLIDYTNMPIAVDVVTEECRTYSDTELTSIQIAYRPKLREVL